MNIPSGRLGSSHHRRPWTLLWSKRVASSSSEEKFWCQISRTWGLSFELGIGRDSRFGWHVQFLLLGIQMVSSAHHESPEKMIKTASQWIWQPPSQGLCGGYGTICVIFPELLGLFKGGWSRNQIWLRRVLIPCTRPYVLKSCAGLGNWVSCPPWIPSMLLLRPQSPAGSHLVKIMRKAWADADVWCKLNLEGREWDFLCFLPQISISQAREWICPPSPAHQQTCYRCVHPERPSSGNDCPTLEVSMTPCHLHMTFVSLSGESVFSFSCMLISFPSFTKSSL